MSLHTLESVGRRLHVRWMIRRDMPEVLGLEAYSLLSWPEKEFLYQLRQKNVIGMVAEHGERVVGAMAYRLEKGHLELLKVVADGDDGYAVLFSKLFSKLSPDRRTAVLLTVHASDARLLRACKLNGMRAVKVHDGLYCDGDGYEFVYRLEEK